MDYYLGEIRIFPFSAVPAGWAPCNGQQLSVQQNSALYSLLGTNYGGNTVNFNLPNLNGTVIVGTGIAAKSGTKYPLGNAGAGGAEAVQITDTTMPAHTHIISSANTYDASNATDEFLGNPNTPTSSTQSNLNPNGSTTNLYAPAGQNTTTLNPKSISNVGGGTAHENRQPYMALVYCIATTGTYPPRPQ